MKHAGEPDEEVIHLVETNVLPGGYDLPQVTGEQITGYTSTDPQLLFAIGCALVGFVIIFGLERLAVSKTD